MKAEFMTEDDVQYWANRRAREERAEAQAMIDALEARVKNLEAWCQELQGKMHDHIQADPHPWGRA